MKDFLRRALGLAMMESLLCAPCLWGDSVQEEGRQAQVLGEEPASEQAESPGREPGTEDGIDYRYLKHIFIDSERLVTRVRQKQNYNWDSEDATTYYYHPYHLGSVSVVSNHRGEPYERVEYLPFGEVWSGEEFLQKLEASLKSYENLVPYEAVPERNDDSGNSNSLVGSILRAVGSEYEPIRCAPGWNKDVLPRSGGGSLLFNNNDRGQRLNSPFIVTVSPAL